MISCPVCSFPQTLILASNVTENLKCLGKSYDYVRCPRCNIVSQHPFPTGDLLGNYYKMIDDKQQAWFASEKGRLFFDKIKCNYLRHQNILKACVKWLAMAGEHLYPYWHQLKPGRIVDLGAGSGGFVLEAARRGLNVTGIEQSDSSVQIGRYLGVELMRADLASSTAQQVISKSENVVMNHVCEHVVDPIGFFVKMRSLMKPDAHLIIVIPNLNSIWRFLFGRRWYGWDPPIHVHHYSAKAIKKMLVSAGFEILELRSIRRNDSLATALTQIGIKLGPVRFILRALIIPIMPILAWIGLGPELLCVAKVCTPSPAPVSSV